MRIEGNSSRLLLLPADPESAGAIYGTEFRDEIQLMIREFLWKSETLVGVPTSLLVSESSRAAPYLSADVKTELRALAEAANVNYQEVLALNTLTDVDDNITQNKLHCSNIVMHDSRAMNPVLLHGRNLDFPIPEALNRATALVLVRPPREGAQFSTALITWAGCVGGFTGCNSAGVSISEVTSPTSDQVTDALPVAFQIRQALERCESAKSAAREFRRMRRTGGFNFAVSDSSGRAPLAVETTHSLCSHRSAVNGRLIVDNCALCSRTARNRLTYSDGVFRYARASALLDQAGQTPTFAIVQGILRDNYDLAYGCHSYRSYRTICNKHTVLSAIFAPHLKRMHLSQFAVPAPLSEFDEIDLERLWSLVETNAAEANYVDLTTHRMDCQHVYIG